MNLDLRYLCKWLKANKISLNASKTELIVFIHPNKELNYELKVKIDGKRLLPSKYVKGILIGSYLNWSYHTDIIASKLSRAIGMLSKIRHYVPKGTLHEIYYGIFSPILTYSCQVWGQIQNKHINRVLKLQDKAIRVINFAQHNESRSPLYKNSKVLKFNDNLALLK